MEKSRISFYTFMKNLDHRIQLVAIGVVVGLFSGLAAVALNTGLKKFSNLFETVENPAFTILLPGAGLLLTVLLMKIVFRDTETKGVADVIFSVSIRGGLLRLRSSISKLVGNLVTISTGGSAGPEAPVIVSGAALGSNIATYLRTNDLMRVAAAGSGAAGAIAAIFNAPITGIIFTMEIILGEWTYINLLPVAISSVSATVMSRLLSGNQIPFKHQLITVGLSDILATAGLSLLLAGIAIGFIKILRLLKHLLAKFLTNTYVRALGGGILVGGAIFFLPAIRGEGYGVVRELISGEFSGMMILMLGLILAKMVVTAVTLGAGGTGGVFAPSLLIGSLTGFFYYQLLIFLFPGLHFSGPSLFALCGMAGMVSGTLAAPLTGIFLIVEITGGYDVILPLLLVSFLAVTMVRFVEKHSIYQASLIEKGLLLRPRTDARILADMDAEELLERDLITLHPEMLLKDLIPFIIQSPRNHFPVADRKSGQFLGMVTFADLKEYIFDPALSRTIIVEEVMHTQPNTVSIQDSVPDILNLFDYTGAWSLPVLEEGKFIGLISKSSLLDHYRKELKAQTIL